MARSLLSFQKTWPQSEKSAARINNPPWRVDDRISIYGAHQATNNNKAWQAYATATSGLLTCCIHHPLHHIISGNIRFPSLELDFSGRHHWRASCWHSRLPLASKDLETQRGIDVTTAVKSSRWGRISKFLNNSQPGNFLWNLTIRVSTCIWATFLLEITKCR